MIFPRTYRSGNRRSAIFIKYFEGIHPNMKLSTRHLGMGMILTGIVLLIVGALYVAQTERFLRSQASVGPEGECVHPGATCPYEQLTKLALPKWIGAAALIGVIVLGAYFALRPK